MSKSRAKGTKFETAVCAYLDEHLPVTVERRAPSGTRDRGDVAGLKGAVVEIKNCKSMTLGAWLAEAEREADNDGGSLAICIHKRRGKTDVGASYASMPVWVLVELLRYWLAADKVYFKRESTTITPLDEVAS